MKTFAIKEVDNKTHTLNKSSVKLSPPKLRDRKKHAFYKFYSN